MKSNWDKKWKGAFKPFEKSGASTGNAICVEVNGVKYDTLSAAAEANDRSIAWVKKHGKIIK